MADIIAEIADERCRQIEQEGWTARHDDSHTLGELSRAAACYALSATRDNHISDDALPVSWPRSWAGAWWKPTTRRRDLVKAAALIIARSSGSTALRARPMADKNEIASR